jgi:hypothetical protein
MPKKPRADKSQKRPRKLEPGKPPPIEKSSRELAWIAISLSPFERDVIDELFRRGGFARLDDLVIAGLWQLAKQLDVPVTTFSKGRV